MKNRKKYIKYIKYIFSFLSLLIILVALFGINIQDKTESGIEKKTLQFEQVILVSIIKNNQNSIDEIQIKNTNENSNDIQKEKIINIEHEVQEVVKEPKDIKFGEQYARLIIDKIGVNAPIFYGANDKIILNGVGHEEDSYFPNENGSIVMCGHNYMNHFSRFDELENGDIIEIKTNYGDFLYRFYEAQVAFETEREKAPIQKDKEILMIYTCFPLKSTEYTQYRYIIYAERL